MTFFKRYKNGIIEYFKYSVIGTSCAVLDLGVLNGLLYFFPTTDTMTLTIYNSTAYTVAVLNSYIWNSKFTFKVKKNKKQFLAFIIQAIISLFIANIIFITGLWLLHFVAVFPEWVKTNLAKGLSMYLSSLASFFFNKLIVFRKESLIEKDKNYKWLGEKK